MGAELWIELGVVCISGIPLASERENLRSAKHMILFYSILAFIRGDACASSG